MPPSADQDPDDRSPAALFLGAAESLPERWISGVAIAFAVGGLGQVEAGVLWFLGLAAIMATEHVLAPQLRRPEPPDRDRFIAALVSVNTGWHMVATGLLWVGHDTLGPMLALALVASTMIHLLLKYHADARLFAWTMAPAWLAVAAGAGALGWQGVEDGTPQVAAAAAVGVGALMYFFDFSRRQLAASREALRQARRTAQEQGRAAEAANAAKSAFLAIMSHEIRTPLNGVLGMAQAMAADTLTPIQRERLDVVRQSGESLLAVLNDVLDLSKIEAGRLELEAIAFYLDEVARGAHAAFTALANKQGLSFDLVVSPAARGVYRGDPVRVRQILYNLVSNALKFTAAGEVRVRLDRVDGALRLSVSDTGCGVAPERLAQLFDPFVQADASTTRQFGGTGLGLSICRDLAALMGGSISAESALGQGSCFTVVLPLERLDEAPELTADEVAEAGPLPPLRVLAAEDNSVNQLVLRTLLYQIGVDPVLVGDGAQALAAWRTEHWDLVLMDVQMPVMDGPTAARAIRAEEAATGRPRTPILALTANAMAHQIAEYMAAGMDGHVSKPIEAARLYAALQAVTEAEPVEIAA